MTSTQYSATSTRLYARFEAAKDAYYHACRIDGAQSRAARDWLREADEAEIAIDAYEQRARAGRYGWAGSKVVTFR